MLKNVLNFFQMSEQYWGCLDKMSEVNFSPAETLDKTYLSLGFLSPLNEFANKTCSI